jgi:hypothetical protein
VILEEQGTDVNPIDRGCKALALVILEGQGTEVNPTDRGAVNFKGILSYSGP